MLWAGLPGSNSLQACPSTLISGFFEMGGKKKVIITRLRCFSMTGSPVHSALSHGRREEESKRAPDLWSHTAFAGDLACLPVCKKLLFPWCATPSPLFPLHPMWPALQPPPPPAEQWELTRWQHKAQLKCVSVHSVGPLPEGRI